ncbi:MAG: hypothetical protein ACO3U4_08665 [Gemmobacter sp.]
MIDFPQRELLEFGKTVPDDFHAIIPISEFSAHKPPFSANAIADAVEHLRAIRESMSPRVHTLRID